MNDNIYENQEEVKIDLGKFFLGKLISEFLRKWWIIIVCGFIVAAIALGVTYKFITPMYRASVTIYVNNTRADQEVDNITSSSLSAATRLVATYVNIIKSDTVLTEVAISGNLPYSPNQIRGMLTAAKVENTEMFKVSVTNANPETAAQIANTIAEVAPAKIEEFVEGSSTKVIDYAKVPTGRFTPSYRANVLIGFGVGLALAVLYITLNCFLDVRIRSAEELNVIFDLPVLGQVPTFGSYSSSMKKKYGYESDGKASDKKNEVKK